MWKCNIKYWFQNQNAINHYEETFNFKILSRRWNDLLTNNKSGCIIILETEWVFQKLNRKEISHKMVLI